MEGNTKLSRQKAYLVPTIIMIVMGIVLFLALISASIGQVCLFGL